MAGQEQIQRPAPQKTTQADAQAIAETDAAVAAAQEKQMDMTLTDELLDEIDGLLEEQEVLTNFRQRGGQ